MSWARGKVDGKDVGYAIPDTCNHPGCEKPIDRRLAYACGGRAGADERSCDGFFCGDHLILSYQQEGATCVDDLVFVCFECAGIGESAA